MGHQRYRLDRVFGVSQVFLRQAGDGKLLFSAVKLTDDLLFTRSRDVINECLRKFKEWFDMKKSIVDVHINFNGGGMSQDHEGNMEMFMKEYTESVNNLYITKERRREQNS